MVMEKDTLGMAFINEEGNSHYPFKLKIVNDEDIKNFVSN